MAHRWGMISVWQHIKCLQLWGMTAANYLIHWTVHKWLTHKGLTLTDTVITQTAVGCSWRSEYFTCKTVLELNHLTFDNDLSRSRWGPVCPWWTSIRYFWNKQQKSILIITTIKPIIKTAATTINWFENHCYKTQNTKVHHWKNPKIRNWKSWNELI